MNSKEIQLSLAFCGALAAMLLISAPVNEKIALAGSGIACIISSGFFYGGINKYFADKEKQTQTAEEQTKLLIENFEAKLKQTQNSTNAQFKSVISNFNDTLSNSLQKTISELQISTNSQLQEVVESIENLNSMLSNSLKRSVSELQISTNKQFQEVVEAIENLDDSFNNSPLNEVADNLSDTVKQIHIDTENIDNNTGKIKALTKTSDEILENIEDVSAKIAEISKLNETLQELLRTMNQQEEFYQTMLNQYKNMTSKDAELIENLARKLR